MTNKSDMHNLKRLIDIGKDKGYITYEELNDDLPDEIISPALKSIGQNEDSSGNESDIRRTVQDFCEATRLGGRAGSRSSPRPRRVDLARPAGRTAWGRRSSRARPVP